MAHTCTKILLADDNKANRKLSYIILKRSGFEVTTVTNGYTALNLTQNNLYHVIILDVVMPVIGGVSALRQIRSQGSLNQNTLIFALTAYFNAQDKKRYIQAGFDCVLTKPFRQGDLETALQRLQEKRETPFAIMPQKTSLILHSLLDREKISRLHQDHDHASSRHMESLFWGTMEDLSKRIVKVLPDALCGYDVPLSKFRRTVHTIKTIADPMGLARISQISTLLQNAPPTEIPHLMHHLVNAIAESRPALSAALTRTRKLNALMEMSG